jgi:hypothetical protein
MLILQTAVAIAQSFSCNALMGEHDHACAPRTKRNSMGWFLAVVNYEPEVTSQATRITAARACMMRRANSPSMYQPILLQAF